MKRVCVLLADGFEEVEAITPIDYLRRVGAAVTVAGIKGRRVEGGHGIVVEAEATLAELVGEAFDCVVVPGGGKGSENIAADGRAVAFIKAHAKAGAIVGSICAAPALVLGRACGLLAGKAFSCYPGMETLVPEGRFRAERVVRDGTLITSRAAGCAGEFAAALAEALVGQEPARKLAESVLLARD